MKKLLLGRFACAQVAAGSLMMLTGGCCILFPPDFNKEMAKARSAQHEMMQKYVHEKRFGQKLPRLEGKDFDELLNSCLQPEQINRIRAAVADEFNRCKTDIVFPKWIEFRTAEIAAQIDKLVAEAQASAKTNGFKLARSKFEQARETGWQGCVSNVGFGDTVVPEIYGPVHKAAVSLIDEKVGVAEWAIVKKEMEGIAQTAISRGDLEEGIQALKDYKPIRTYTKVLDQKVAAFVAELKKLGVSESATRLIVQNTEAWMRKYERLCDKTEDYKSVKQTIGGGQKVSTRAYEDLLKDYEAALRKYDCTDVNTRKIIDALAKYVARLIADLPEPEAPREVVTKRLSSLGATKLNEYIENLRTELLAKLSKNLEESQKRGAEINALLKGDPSKALEKIASILSGAEEADANIRAMAMKKLLTEVNPALWEKIKKEVIAKVKEFAAENACSEGIAWLEKYPYVRTYDEAIDKSFAAVKSSAIACGVPAATAEAIMDEVARSAAQVERLADYTDRVEDKVTPGTAVPAEKLKVFEAKVVEARATLIRNGCTEANADKLAAAMRARFAEEKAVLEADVHTSVFYLGSNALNKRLKSLKEECAGALIGRCVSAYVSQKRFAEARSLIRDIALTGNSEFDEKVYVMRVGVLNTVVNPIQCKTLKEKILVDIASFWRKGDYRALRDWMNAFNYVHDAYPDLLKAAKDIQMAMTHLKIEEPDPEQYMAKVRAKVRSTIEEAESGYRLPAARHDLTELERALDVFEQAYVAQFYKKDIVHATRQAISEDVKKCLSKEVLSLSTAKLNAELRALMESEIRRLALADAQARKPRYQLADDPVAPDMVKEAVLEAAKKGFVAFAAGKTKEEVYAEIAGAIAQPAIEWLRKLWDELDKPKTLPDASETDKLAFDKLLQMLVDRQEYLEFLAAMDREVVYDSQIAMAEDAIAKQLCDVPPETHLGVNALLGEYARAMRLLKQAKTLNKDQGAALVVGSVYLDQPAVFSRALELGADVNAVSPRDSLKRTALLLAIQLGRTAFVHRLVEAGADIQLVDAAKNTAVHYAVRRGSLAILQAMLAKVDVDLQNDKGETALFDAARSNEPALVQALVKASANVAKENSDKRTAFDAACAAGCRDVLEPLAAAGAVFGTEQLVLAVENDRLAVAQWLVAQGVDVNGPGVMEMSEKRRVEEKKSSLPVQTFLLHQGGVLRPYAPAK